MERKQFTFYASFFQAVDNLKSMRAREQLYTAICKYALYEKEPDLATMHNEAVPIFVLIKPILDTASKRASAGAIKKQNQNKTESKRNQKQNKKEIEIEIEKELKIEIERESENARASFDIFWNAFPKKTDKEGAWEAFQEAGVDLQVMLSALQKHKNSAQWLEAGGRFVPKAATWLREKRWENVPPAGASSVNPSGELGEAELAAIRKMLEE